MAEKPKITLADVMQKYNKEQGQGSIAYLSDESIAQIEATSSGVLSVDLLVSKAQRGAFPKGGIVELYGPEASMKTTLATYAIRECQKETGKVCAILDIEQAFNREVAIMVGVDLDRVVFAQPRTTEEALTLIEDLASTGEIGMILVDSVAAMVPKAELEGEFGESKMGVQARLMSQGMRKLVGLLGITETCCVFINQTRDKIGVSYGNPEVTTSGNALKFYSSVRIRCSSSKMQGKEDLGREVTFKLIKNKLAASATGKSITVPYFYSIGFSKEHELVEIATDAGVIQKSGSWYSYDGAKIGQGVDKSAEFIKDNEDLYKEIFDKVFKQETENVAV